jgi:serine/threonine protein kinase
MAVCWLGRPESKLWEMILWTVIAVAVIAMQVVADSCHGRVRRACCREASALPEAPRKTKTCMEKLQRWRKVAAMTYCMLYPLLLKVLVEGLVCTKDFKWNFIDMATPCPLSRAVSIGLIVAWTLPAVAMSLVVVRHYQRDHLNDEEFLHNWGFLVIGYKPDRIFWPLLDLLELCLYLALYASNFNFIEPSIRLTLNWIVCAIKLFSQSWLKPYESKTIDASTRQNYVFLLALFFVASTLTVPAVEHCNPLYFAVLTVVYYTTLWPFLVGSVLFHTFDFCFHGAVSTAVSQRCRRCVRKAGDDLEEDAPAIDVVEDYRIPSEDLTVRVQERLGSGGAGSVYKADWTQDAKPVAAKELIETLMDAQQTMEFEREVKNLIQANHRAVINFYGICDKYDARLQQNRRYIVMEYAENGSLEGTLAIMSRSYSAQVERLAGGPRMARTLQMVYPLSVGQILTWALDIASALKYLNSRGMPHRDVKPQNIFLDANNRAKVGDLGFAKLHSTVAAMRPAAPASSVRIERQKSKAEAPPSEDQFGGGTPEYMAPEAFNLPPSQWGEKVDVWAYGVTLKRIVTLAQPFEDGARHNYKVDVPAGRVRPFAHVPAARIHYAHPTLETLLDACLHFHPAERPTFGIIFDVLKKMRNLQSAKVITARRTEVFNPLLMGAYEAPAAVARPRLSSIELSGAYNTQ